MKNVFVSLAILALTATTAIGQYHDIPLGPGETLVSVDGKPVNQGTRQPVYQARQQPRQVSRGYNSAIAEVNSLRSRRGLPALIEDPSLSAIAYQKASIQANRGGMYHPGGSMGSARYEGVGMGRQFITCYLYASNVQYGGAATVVGRNGQRFHCLLVK